MPILYGCIVNQHKAIVVECRGTSNLGDFREQILANRKEFVKFGKKNIPLNSQGSENLSYMDQKQYTMCCISTSYDVTLLEAQKYLGRLEQEVTECFADQELQSKRGSIFLNDTGGAGRSSSVRLNTGTSLPIGEDIPDIADIEPHHCENLAYEGFFKTMNKRIEKFTREWNCDVTNRDKTVQVQYQALDTMEKIQDNLNQMLDRNGKIDEALVKGEQLQVVAHRYKKSTTIVKEEKKTKYRCFWCWIILGILSAIAAAIIVCHFIFKLF